jgi:hypothetical protein
MLVQYRDSVVALADIGHGKLHSLETAVSTLIITGAAGLTVRASLLHPAGIAFLAVGPSHGLDIGLGIAYLHDGVPA